MNIYLQATRVISMIDDEPARVSQEIPQVLYL